MLRPGTAGAGAESAQDPGQVGNLLIVLVIGFDRAAMRGLAYAAGLGQPAFALHISPTDDEAGRFRGYWQAWGNYLPLEVIVSPHRALVAPLVNYIWSLRVLLAGLTLTVIVPEIVSRRWWEGILHAHVSGRLRRTRPEGVRRDSPQLTTCRLPTCDAEDGM